MIYSIAEISDLIKLSKVSIYKKLKQQNLSEHTTKKKGITYIDDIGFNLLKESFNINDNINLNNNVKTELEPKNIDNTTNAEVATDIVSFNINQELFNMLKEQLKEKENQLNIKDKRLDEANERLKQAHKLIENDQILQLRLQLKQPQNIKELEDHFQDLDTKIEEVKETMSQKNDQPQNIKELEDHFQDLDSKLEEVKEIMSQRKNQQHHKSIFSRIFKK